MDVIHMASIIRIVANHVLPKTPLPYSALTPLGATNGSCFGLGDTARKTRFDQSPAGRIIRVIWRQRPDAMQMIRQYHDGIQPKRMSGLNMAEGITQAVDVIGQQMIMPSFNQIHREKPRCAW